ncbi:MAG: hypothetical protein R2751_13990 [Bacteroidales bacterium]
MAGFQQYLLNFVLQNMERTERYHYSPTDLEAIQSLRDQKFVNWEWNFGYSLLSFPPDGCRSGPCPGSGAGSGEGHHPGPGDPGCRRPGTGKGQAASLADRSHPRSGNTGESLSVLRISEVLWKELDNEDFLSALF